MLFQWPNKLLCYAPFGTYVSCLCLFMVQWAHVLPLGLLFLHHPLHHGSQWILLPISLSTQVKYESFKKSLDFDMLEVQWQKKSMGNNTGSDGTTCVHTQFTQCTVLTKTPNVNDSVCWHKSCSALQKEPSHSQAFPSLHHLHNSDLGAAGRAPFLSFVVSVSLSLYKCPGFSFPGYQPPLRQIRFHLSN